jgi:hypothetical protein
MAAAHVYRNKELIEKGELRAAMYLGVNSFLRLILGGAHLLNPSYFRDLFNKIQRRLALSARFSPGKRQFKHLLFLLRFGDRGVPV